LTSQVSGSKKKDVRQDDKLSTVTAPAGTIALTFDDGPDPTWTPRLLESLAAVGARATFFPIARPAAEHPELVERIATEGHAIGLHCNQHIRHTERDAEWVRRDTCTALELLRAVGVRPSLWRTPWGNTADFTGSVAAEHALRLVSWSVDSHDWRGDDAAGMFERTRSGLRSGSIVLAHDGLGPGARREGIAETLGYVERVAAHASARGLRLEALA
jgi:peptidoglycan/xylan/chitin deacetylase (PgdA/CDA1 family)